MKIKKMNYWIAHCKNDCESLSIVGRTKNEVIEKLKDYIVEDFDQIEHRQIEYTDAFDLFDFVTSSAGGRYFAGTPFKR